MRTGSLVRIRANTSVEANGAENTFVHIPSGTVGIIIKSKQPTPNLPVGSALVRFEFCESYFYWRQLEIINE
jgi:hypothetical protein